MPSKYGRQPCREFNVVVLGTGGVGKSCLTAQFVHQEWIENYDPTIEDSYRTQLSVDGRQVVLEILDTAGADQFVAMRDLYMKTGQGFILVFSITSRDSFDELEALRHDIIRIKDDENIPIVIVGNKADLVEQRGVDRARAFALSQQWQAPYYESSARTRTNVDEAFIDLCRQMLRQEDQHDDSRIDDIYYHKADGPSSSSKGRRRRRLRDNKEHRCNIL